MSFSKVCSDVDRYVVGVVLFGSFVDRRFDVPVSPDHRTEQRLHLVKHAGHHGDAPPEAVAADGRAEQEF